MKVVRKGDGAPEFTVLGSVHGDEPAGKKAIEELLEEEIRFKRPVQFIIGNEKALSADQRFLDADLNRSFPGDPESKIYEKKLASEIIEKVEGTKILDIHTTRSYPLPFATCAKMNDAVKEMIRSTGVKNAAHFPQKEGKLIEKVEAGIVVEAGFQGTEQAAANALGTIKNFLSCQNAVDLKGRKSRPQFFKVEEKVEGDWRFKAENFKKVEKGRIYAAKENEQLKASEDFYPVLMSTNGYNGALGYQAQKKQI